MAGEMGTEDRILFRKHWEGDRSGSVRRLPSCDYVRNLAVLSSPKGRESSLLRDQEEYYLCPTGGWKGSRSHLGRLRKLQADVYGREPVLTVRLPRPARLY